MLKVDGFAPGSFPHTLRDHASYEQACAACEHTVTISTPAQHVSCKASLYFDLRPGGNRGRCLGEAVPSLGLLKGDRLEPCEQMVDIMEFDNKALPFTCVFWRCSSETTTRRRNPLFNAATGVTVETTVIDTMHCLHLGVMQKYVSWIWWGLVAGNAWRVLASNNDELLSKSVSHLRGELFSWYPAYKQERGRNTPRQKCPTSPSRRWGRRARTC